MICCKNSLKILKGSVNRRWTDNTMANRKRTNNDLQNIHIKSSDIIPLPICPNAHEGFRLPIFIHDQGIQFIVRTFVNVGCLSVAYLS